MNRPQPQPSHRTIVHVDMNAFFASVEQATNPALRDKPIAVIGAKDRTVVLTASYAAKACGVKTGSTVYEAKKRCPSVLFVTTNPYKYMDTSRRIMRIFQQYTPIVEVCSIDEAFLDVTGSLYLFSSAETIARRIKQDIGRTFHLTCSIGVAPNKTLAKLAANLHKPDGLVRILPDDVPQCLAPIPIDKICGIGPQTTKFFHAQGIHTCGQLQQIPRSYLKKKFGVAGEWLHDVAFGRDNARVIPADEEADPKSVGHSMTLKTDAETRAEIEMHLQHLSEMVGRRLRMGMFSGRTVAVTVRYSSFTSCTKRRTFYFDLRFAADIFHAARKVWQDMPMPEPIRLVGVSVSNLRIQMHQVPLFPDERRKLNVTMALDKVNNKFGEFTIFPAALLARNNRERTIAPSWRPHGIRQAIRR